MTTTNNTHKYPTGTQWVAGFARFVITSCRPVGGWMGAKVYYYVTRTFQDGHTNRLLMCESKIEGRLGR